jgi:hypothetical protein
MILCLESEYGGMNVSEAQEANQLREENSRLKKLVVDLALVKHQRVCRQQESSPGEGQNKWGTSRLSPHFLSPHF